MMDQKDIEFTLELKKIMDHPDGSRVYLKALAETVEDLHQHAQILSERLELIARDLRILYSEVERSKSI